MLKIRLAAPLQSDSILDGEGIRTIVWTQGCAHNCPFCHNPETHSFKGGYLEEPESSEIEPKTVIEDSYAIIHKPITKESQDEFFDEMLGLCGKYNQDSVLICLLNRLDKPKAAYNSAGNIVYGPFEKLTFNDVEEFFTELHGHKFKMESFTESEDGIKPTSFNNAAAYYGTKAKVKLYKR